MSPHSSVPETPITAVLDVDAFDEAAQKLTSAGVSIDRRNPDIGTISGRFRGSSLADLEQLDGVVAVERDGAVGVAPPDSPVQ